MRRTVPMVLLLLLAAGCTPAPAAPEPTPTATSAQVTTAEAPSRAQALPVYYVAGTPAGPRLQREFHNVTTADPATDALHEMFGPAADPDYGNPWPEGTALRSPVVRRDGRFVVDLTAAAAEAPSDPAAAAIAVQQLVFTVQGAAQSTDPVVLLVDGAPVARVLGSVDVSAPVTRGDPYALRSLVQIDAPAEGASMGREVLVSGEAAVFEATVHWEVLRGEVIVASGFTMSAEGQRFAAYEFTVTLEPGTYRVRVLEDDPSDGAAGPVDTDDKTITVSG